MPVLRDADQIVLPWHRREIAGEHQQFSRISAAPYKTENASLEVFAIDPLKTGGVSIQFVQGRLFAVKTIQVPQPTRQTRVKRTINRLPVETSVVVPLCPLPEFVAHE